MDQDALRQWLEGLDSASYYDLFGVAPNAAFDDVRSAFHAFTEAFHPDVHTWRPTSEQDAVRRIFKRGTEAYRVLSDPTLRVRYDELRAGRRPGSEPPIADLESSKPKSLAPPGSTRPIDNVRVSGARPFVVRAEELMKQGDPKQAKIQLVMAMHRDPNNAALEAYAKELDGAIQAKADLEKKAWKR